jgi:hypothetical protein
MSGAKHTVATDALETLGTILGEGAGRDAIHLAVEPVYAVETLHPGQHVGFVTNDNGVGACDDPVGIVDPFLNEFIQKGEHFWLVVYPRQITSLRHVWTHPKFKDMEGPTVVAAVAPPSDEVSKAIAWMQNYADEIEVGYSELLDRARSYVEYGDYWSEGGKFESMSVPVEFWDHYELITDHHVDPTDKGNFFSCSC